MDILPATTVTDITTQFGSVVSDNAVVIIGVLALGIGVGFVMRWFNKSTKKLKA